MSRRTDVTSGRSKVNLIIAAVFIVGLIFIGNYFYRDLNQAANDKTTLNPGNKSDVTATKKIEGGVEISNYDYLKSYPYLPSTNGEVVHHKYYSLSYIEAYEQAEWVCYKLTKEILQRPNFPRSDWFDPDPLVLTGSAKHFQYKGSGYTRGHIAPAGDMSFDQTAMVECFYMSNMMPQLRSVNNGIWRELEEQSRDWVYQNSEVYIVSGPIFGKHPKFFKKQKIAIPSGFYKIIFDVSEPTIKAIAFSIPHETSIRPLHDYSVTIDSIESLTGIDFFPALFNTNKMAAIESKIDKSLWPVSEARYRLRVDHWNHE